MNPVRAFIDEILDRFEYLGRDELDVVLEVCRRIDGGLRTYGPLNVEDGRRWRVQAAEEYIDAGVYGCCELLREERRVEEARRRAMGQEERAQVELAELERKTASRRRR